MINNIQNYYADFHSLPLRRAHDKNIKSLIACEYGNDVIVNIINVDAEKLTSEIIL